MTATTDHDLLWPRYRDPADVAAIEAVPLADRGLPPSTYDLLRRAATRWPDQPAISVLPSAQAWDDPVNLTYAELLTRVHRLANVLHRVGVRRGDPVAVLCPNTSDVLAGSLAAQVVGVTAPVNPGLAADRVRGLIAAAGSRVLLAAGPELDPQVWDTVLQVAADSGLETVLVLRPDAAPADAPVGASVDAPVDAPVGAPPLPEVPGVRFAYADQLASGEPGDRLLVNPPGPQDLAGYFHTGGTTGTPKIAVHTQANQVAMAWMVAAHESIRPDDVAFAALPLFHVNALLLTVLTPLLAGRPVVWAPPLGYRDPGLYGVFWKVIERYRVTGMSAVPTVYAVLSHVPVDADISSLRAPIVGAAPLPEAVRQAFAEHTGVELLEGYGMTEATCASTATWPGHARQGTVGQRLPYQRVKAVAVDEDTGQWRDLAPGQPGLLVISGPTVFAGYLRDGVPTQDGVVRDGWLDTGDLGSVDEDGYVRLTGRAKDLIIRGGHNIDPTTIEDTLLGHPAVAAAAAVGRPDRHSGEVPVAYVVLHPGADVTGDELREWAAGHVAEAAAAPKDVRILDQLPLTLIGKVYKPALRTDAARRVARRELADLADVGVRVEDGTGAGGTDGGTDGGIEMVRIVAPADAGVRRRVGDILAGLAVQWRFSDDDAP
jgi:fatty-acyl-CoA synthase